MQSLDVNLLTLIVALSAYVATIRLAVLARLVQNPQLPEDQRAKQKRFLILLIPADLLLVVAGVALLLLLFWAHLFSSPGAPAATAPKGLEQVVVWCFFLGILWLVGHHIGSWCKTLKS